MSPDSRNSGSSQFLLDLLSASNASCDNIWNRRKSDTKITMSQHLLNTISKFSFFNVYNLHLIFNVVDNVIVK